MRYGGANFVFVTHFVCMCSIALLLFLRLLRAHLVVWLQVCFVFCAVLFSFFSFANWCVLKLFQVVNLHYYLCYFSLYH